ncbi:hypothetical protein Bca52824_001968 [Brassica carinata]|uniref:GH16 domain-containing protein n=1 Tax=Brassica carinata TaxID=52824 RepID=A0A8X8BDV9_BRACI|nr:hypothetical protein Bca52824_001968 [Brassica carinata]
MVDETPIRVHKNLEDKGIPFAKDQAMGVYSSIWNADDWATQGGLVKTDWSHAPFIVSYKDFKIDACEVPTTTDLSKCNGEDQRFWLGRDWPTTLRDSTESEQYETSSSSSNGSFTSASVSPSDVTEEHFTSLRLLRLLELQVIIKTVTKNVAK